MKNRGVKFKLIFGVVLIIIIPLSVVGYFSGEKAAGMIRQNAEIQSVRTASSLANSVELVMAEQVRIVRGLAENFRSFGGMDLRFYGGAGIDDLTSRRVNLKIFNTLKGLGENYESIYLLDTKGVLFAGSDENGETPFYGKDISATRFFSDMKDLGDTVTSSVFVSEITSKPVVVFCSPILDQQDRVAGAIGMTFKLDPFITLVSGTKNGETGYVFMVNSEGTMLAHPDSEYILQLNINQVAGMDAITSAMLSGDSGVGQYEFMGQNKVAGYAPVGNTGWFIAVTQNSDEFMILARSLRKFNALIATGFVGLALLAAMLFKKSILKPIEKAVEYISRGTHQISCAAEQVSSGSATVADAASKQMVTLDETVITLEEVLGTVNDTAEKANQAEIFVRNSKQLVQETTGIMTALNMSIAAIEVSEKETATIVNAIDGIAFQTNLLALNASVEAARAGEAGRGFAVVARHVRSLAQEAAEAARTSANLIEETTLKVRDGAELTRKAQDAFFKVSEHTVRYTAFIEEISSASSRQAASIGKISRSVSSLETITRQYATFAEESATASRQMHGEVTAMSEVAEELSALIGTSGPARGETNVPRKSTAPVASGGPACLGKTYVGQSLLTIPDSRTVDAVKKSAGLQSFFIKQQKPIFEDAA